ncbi:DegT/DnrJ/EryC1/StrS family aminotransferase [Paenibacillus roseipurpureus]|uniref:DegT/DnrJ/EryC1/StrS family aminotransferase n=1 Tax=Paenibacillus roseopurpureus TaxID=2918901 RepID=A0AA96LYG2_9BACL|nr:DegT/DnrJ/EryC1/StrS family aminotransferase [Paenibacillus sp. MBLB1832]WNR46840.1 DegT/DnrJ/EryC1/StrS family aminotransferase [Paenibacillus sp. MBLB1832]
MNPKLAIHGGTAVRSIPLPPLLRGALVIGGEEKEEVDRVIDSKALFRYYGNDVQHCVERLEHQIAQEANVPYALGVTSGTAALIVALKALGIGYGDKVIVPANTFTATAGAVICANAVPVYADIDESMNLDPHDLERVYDNEVKAIIAVPINGTPCDMDGIMAFAREKGIYVIEDVAQSLGTTYKGRFAGSIGHIGTFSFQMQKTITAGEGGAIITHDAGLFERAVRYHDQGSFREKMRYGFETGEQQAFAGQNYRMSELTGAVLLAQWKKLDPIISVMRHRQQAARRAIEARLPQVRFRKSPDPAGDTGSVLGLFLPDAETAVRFAQAVEAEGVTCFRMYGGRPIYMTPFLLHQRTAEKNNFPFDFPFRHPVAYKPGMCPVAEDLLSRYVHIPISPTLTERDAEDIAEAVVKVYEGLGVDQWTKA